MFETQPTQLLSEDEHIIENIFPAREVHLVGGPSGAGKTTWLMKMIEAWQRGENIFGNASHPAPFLYVSLDRSLAGMKRTMKRLKIDISTFPMEAIARTQRKYTLNQLLDSLLKKHPLTKVFFLEGFATKVPGGKLNDYAVVSDFLTSLADYCQDKNITIIGVVHSSKTKGEDKFENPRQRVMGSAAWASYAETIVMVEPATPDDPEDTTRTLMVLPRNAKERVYKFEFLGGLLVEKKPMAAKITNTQIAKSWLATLTPREGYSEKDGINFSFEEFREGTSLADTSARRELQYLEAARLIRKIDHGVYKSFLHLQNASA